LNQACTSAFLILFHFFPDREYPKTLTAANGFRGVEMSTSFHARFRSSLIPRWSWMRLDFTKDAGIFMVATIITPFVYGFPAIVK